MYRYDRLNGAAMTEAIFETGWGCKDDGKAGVVDVMEVDLKWFDGRWVFGLVCLSHQSDCGYLLPSIQLNPTSTCRLCIAQSVVRSIHNDARGNFQLKYEIRAS